MIEPTTSHALFDNAVQVLCFGKSSGSWALKGYEPEKNVARDPNIVRKIAAVRSTHSVGRLYLPSPHEFNAEIAWPSDLNVPWLPGRIFRGANADGLALDKIGDACGIASSDCPTIVARHAVSGLVIAAHAGRESLYDRQSVVFGRQPRQSPSIVTAIMKILAPSGSTGIGDIHVFITCGIRSECFTHREDDRDNSRMLSHFRETCRYPCVSDDGMGRLDLPLIIRSQFEVYGVPSDHISDDGVCTFEDMRLSAGYSWYSHRRDGDGNRNLVLVIRRS